MIRKKGEITAFYLISLILAIAGFVVVVLLLFSLEFENFQSDEICRLSVLTRATSPTGFQGFVPLQCSTAKICITDELFGKCEQFAGEDNVKTVRLSNDVNKATKEIEKIYADSMYSCWTEMGEGKLDLFRGVDTGLIDSLNLGELKAIKSSCRICSRVAIDYDFIYEENKGKYEDIIRPRAKEILSKVDVNNYLVSNFPDGEKDSYYSLLNDGSQRFSTGYEELTNKLNSNSNEPDFVDQFAFIFMQINTGEKSPFDTFVSSSLTSATLSGGTIGTIFGLSSIASLPAAATSVSLVAVSSLSVGIYGAYQQSQNRALASARCGKFVSSDEAASQGCSVLFPVDYNDISKINSICGRIEGQV